MTATKRTRDTGFLQFLFNDNNLRSSLRLPDPSCSQDCPLGSCTLLYRTSEQTHTTSMLAPVDDSTFHMQVAGVCVRACARVHTQVHRGACSDGYEGG